MWAVGCILVELLKGERLDGPIWDSGQEVGSHTRGFPTSSSRVKALVQPGSRAVLLLLVFRVNATL